ncbi:MAG: tetratricopeptide repeat protein, partial [Algoriella sp.]
IEAEQETAEREIKYKLIDDFLEKNPKIIPMKKTDITPIQVSSNFSHNSEEYSDLMTETLAQIYIEQKKYDKAIKAYKILILKYPEKNSLFANRIKGIENLKNSK